MLKGNNKYYLILLLLFALMVWMEYSQPQPIDWRRTYASADKIPFGCNAFYRLLNEDIYKGNVEQKNQTLYNSLETMPNEKTSYIFINNTVSFSDLDCKHLFDFVSRGNNVLIAANNFGGLLADTFKIETAYSFDFLGDTTKKIEFNFCNKHLRSNKNFIYSKGMDVYFFKKFDTLQSTVLAVTPDSNALFIKATMGKGCFYFVSIPDLYTNYFVVNNINKEAAYTTLNYLNSSKIYWDEFYKTYNKIQGSELQFIFANNSLYAAYSLALIALLIFMVFALKRRQKAIPIVEPLQNTTLQFVEVVGSVYYNAKNHKIIAEEKINSFYEFLRAKFLITGRNFTTDDLTRISKLSAISLDEIKKLFSMINITIKQSSITEKELIELNTLIENFYKQNKR